jgi:hypothetical protein
MLFQVPASDAAVTAGLLTVTQPDGLTPLNTGGSQTQWTVQLPHLAACSKDTFTNQYHVNSYIIPAATDPTTLSFSSTGPVDPKGGLAFPLVDTTGSAYTAQATAPNTGQVQQPPSFNYAAFTIDGRNGTPSLPAGTYNVGIACSTNAATANLDQLWNVQETLSASSSDPNGETWTVVPGSGGGGGSTTTTTAPTGSTTTTPTTIPTGSGGSTTTTAPTATTAPAAATTIPAATGTTLAGGTSNALALGNDTSASSGTTAPPVSASSTGGTQGPQQFAATGSTSRRSIVVALTLIGSGLGIVIMTRRREDDVQTLSDDLREG